MIFKKRWLLVVIMFAVCIGQLIPASDSVNAAESTRDRGIDVVFVMDHSGSMDSSDQTAIRIDAAKNLIGSLNEYDRASVIKFNSEAENLQSLTNNRYLITGTNGALDRVLPNDGGTDMSKGIDLAIKEFQKNSGNNHKIMIVLTDGGSESNPASLQLADEANEKNITIYTIGLGDKSAINETVLKDIATKTGGTYEYAVNSSWLTTVFTKIYKSISDIREPKVYSDWTLTEDLDIKKTSTNPDGNLVLTENMKLDLNGYDLRVEGDLVLLSCSELRAVSGKISAKKLEQEAGSTLHLNNSRLEVDTDFIQDGIVRVNGQFGSNKATDEIVIAGNYDQKIRGELSLAGQSVLVKGNSIQEGHINVQGGLIHVNQDVTQKGWVDLGQGTLLVDGNLVINGGPLIDNEFKENKSMNVNGGLLQVGSATSLAIDRSKGNVAQESGQLYVNNGTVDIYGDYVIKNGWLTMIHGSMDTKGEFKPGDGDYVHVYRDFETRSPRNHAERLYSHLGKPMFDQNHLTEGVLQVDGTFTQIGDKQHHASYSDRYTEYKQDYSRFNFVATGRHKVLLTGKQKIAVQGTGFTFNILELKGKLLNDYPTVGPVRWNDLDETEALSSNANLKSLSINDTPVWGFTATTLNYPNVVVSAEDISGQLRELKVDAQADDYRNATVKIVGNTIVGGTAQVKILVTAHDGTEKVYTVDVTVGNETPGKVTGITLDKTEQIFIGASSFNPTKATIGYTVSPGNAADQRVIWTSTDPTVATVSANGVVTPIKVGEATITATTVDGNYTASMNVSVKLPYDLLEGIKTLADFVSDADRYNKIIALYDPSKIGIVVPGQYIKSVKFTTTGSNFVSGKIVTEATVRRVEVNVNELQLSAQSLLSGGFVFSRTGLQVGDRVEVIAYNEAGNELERISTVYPGPNSNLFDYQPISSISYGFYSIEYLFNNPSIFNDILDNYSMKALQFTAK